MAPYKLIALDMDGTLLDDQQNISAENRFWIEKALENGITVSFSTGRGVQSVLPFVEQLNLDTPLVTVNGGEVWEKPHLLLKRSVMDPQLIKQLHQLSIDHDIWFWAYAVEGLFNKDNWQPDLDVRQWLKFGYYTENDEIRNQIHKTIARWNQLEITNSHPFNLECNPKGVSKANALEEVCKLLGIQMSQVVAMGDSLNDASMIRAAGLGVAMGNAQDEIKGIADLVTDTNVQDGVAKVIRDYVLKG